MGWSSLLIVALTTVFAILYGPSLKESEVAREGYEEARKELDAITTRRRSLEQRVDELRTRVDSVELSARVEYRLARPGERVELIQHFPPDDS